MGAARTVLSVRPAKPVHRWHLCPSLWSIPSDLSALHSKEPRWIRHMLIPNRRIPLSGMIATTAALCSGCAARWSRARAQVLASPRGRGTQMNAGARRAAGDLLLFLHADSALPADFQQSILAALQLQTLRMQRPARSALAIAGVQYRDLWEDHRSDASQEM